MKICNFLTVALIILLSALGTSVSANAMWYLCGDKAVRLNLNDQSVSISRFGTPKPLSSNTMPTSKMKTVLNGVINHPSKPAQFDTDGIGYGYERNGLTPVPYNGAFGHPFEAVRTRVTSF